MATLAEGWYVGGVSVEDFGTVLEDREGWDDVPGMRGGNVVLLGRHGESWRRKRFEPGRKVLTIGVHGADTTTWVAPATNALQRAAYEANLDGLLRLLAPRHATVTVTRVHANGDQRQAECEVVSQIVPKISGQSYGQVQVEFAVPGTFWEDVDAITHALAYDVSAGGEQDCEVYSLAGQTGYCSDGVVVVTGPCSTVSVVDEQTGSGWSYGSALGSGERLTVDSGAFTAVYNDGADHDVLTSLVLTTAATLLEVSPAPYSYQGPNLAVTTSGASGAMGVTFTGRRKWVR